MYSLSSRCIRNGIQASPLSIQIDLSFGKRSGMPFTTQLVMCTMLNKVKPSACDGDEVVGDVHALVAPVGRRVEGERQAALLERRVELHVGVVVERLVAHAS